MATTDLTTNLKALAASWRHLDALMSGKADTPYSTTPEVGLTPVEVWNDGKRVHFGNTIVEVTTAADAGRNLSQDGESRSASMRNVLSTCESRLMHEASKHGSPALSSTGNLVAKGPR